MAKHFMMWRLMMEYNVVENEDTYTIELLETPYAGVKYSYGKVEIVEPKEGEDHATLSFEYNLYYSQDEKLQEDQLFHKTIGDILVKMIEEKLATGELVYTGGK